MGLEFEQISVCSFIDGFAGTVTDERDNFAGVETMAPHRLVKQEVLRSLRERRRSVIVVQTHRFTLQPTDLRPSEAFDAPMSRGQGIEVFLAQLNSMITACSASGGFSYFG